MENCAIVVPVFNEEQSIAQTLDQIQAAIARVPSVEFEIVCVNDGSSDRSGDILRSRKGITLHEHDVNRGYGAALVTAISRTKRDWIVIVDADGTYPIGDIPVLLTALDKGTDMVVGARKGAGISSNPFKALARWVLRRMVKALTGIMVPDLNSGMRVFRRQLFLEFRHLLPRGFSFTSTITVASLYSGYRIRYLPIEYARRNGTSSIQPIRDFFRFTILIVRLASYFEPLRFFLPVAMALFLTGLARGVRDIVVTNAIGSLAVIIEMGAFQVFILGVVADVVVRGRASKEPGSRDA